MSNAAVEPLVPHFMSRYVDSMLLHTCRTPKPRISEEELEEIRSQSREKWNEVLEFQDNTPTQVPLRSSYTVHYTNSNARNVKAKDYRSNHSPRSPTRRNRPHPSMSFMIWHQHDNPSFSSKLQAGGKKNELLTAEKKRKRETRSQGKDVRRYIPEKVHSAPEQQMLLETSLNSTALPKAESWMRQANTPDRNAVLSMLEVCGDQGTTRKRHTANVKPVTYASLNRYLKEAGREEKDALVRLTKSLSVDPYEAGHINKGLVGRQDSDRYILGKRERATSGRIENRKCLY